MPAQQAFVELAHERSDGAVADAPQAGQNLRTAGIHETARQSDEAFAANLFAERGLACAEHHQVGVQLQIVDFVKTQESILRIAVAIDHGENDSRKLRAAAVQKSVSGEMNQAITAQVRLLRRGSG